MTAQGRRRRAVDLVVIAALAAAVGLLGLSCRRLEPTAAERMCMSNIKQVLGAIRMYLNDNDNCLPPYGSTGEKRVYVKGHGLDPLTGTPVTEPGEADGRLWTREANPYLRWPVILDSYVGDRGAWRCPEALLEHAAAFIIGPPNWLEHLQAHEDEWGHGTELWLAMPTWPAGWGGEVTDSITQGRLASDAAGPTAEGVPAGVFVQSIAVNTAAGRDRRWRKADPARYVICADGGAQVEWMSTGTLAYPDICALECANEQCGWADWEECTWAADCGLYNVAPKNGSFLRNPKLREPYSRHRGGVNIGFLDGHAQWFHSEHVLALSPTQKREVKLLGYGPLGRTADCAPPGEEDVPTLY
jgi:prepilin-type processing-associated H-X9-DG protein